LAAIRLASSLVSSLAAGRSALVGLPSNRIDFCLSLCKERSLYAQLWQGGAGNGGHSAPESGRSKQLKRTVALPVRKSNAAYRSREHLTEREVERLVEAAKNNRWGHRDSTMVLLAFRHGLRASELVDLRWEQVDLENAILHVRRVKQGTPATHPLTGRELRALRRLQREQESKSPFVFVSERGAPFSTRGFQAMVERAAEAAGFDMKIHPHMLRHSCGYKLANDRVDTRTIQSYLGHKSIQHTVRYTELAPTRFKSLFRD
jgi:type 1 fimbriae regulatory protein FimB/type 1 fimbriae regulatory protein FimE